MAWHEMTPSTKRHYFVDDRQSLCRSWWRDEAVAGPGDEDDGDRANCRACAGKVAARRRRAGEPVAPPPPPSQAATPRSDDYRRGYSAGYQAGERAREKR